MIFLRKIDVRDRNICNLLGVSKSFLYGYLKNYPITEEELNAINTQRDNLVAYFWQYIINNRVNQPQNINFRLPENNVQKQRISQVNKVVQKSLFVQPDKKDDEIVKDKTGFDELEEYQNRLKENIVDE
ncbi:MAG: hypothetical protein IKZ88_08500 [Neisseriaceae bacterium]|nr:hypothetical protein [Neisseriaceae bacterium]